MYLAVEDSHLFTHPPNMGINPNNSTTDSILRNFTNWNKSENIVHQLCSLILH